MFRAAFLAATVLLGGARLGVGQTPAACACRRPEGSRLFTLNADKTGFHSRFVFSQGPCRSDCFAGISGIQCPHCVSQVHDFVLNAEKFAAAGTQVVLVHPGPPADLDQRQGFLAAQSPLPRT
jgi:hypothetical protein